MLKLHRLDLSGFKTFVDPVGIDFAGGVTAIVGPNGCGKSNLSDAVTWALGEQSAKSLRGESMEDVIFNGTETRKALGMGEVSLTLQADPGSPGTDENGRLVLTRRVFRSGESQYRLNGKTVRLKDFKDLLMDTGLGIRAYSVIEQGKIGMILSGKPQERRKLLEEAAGITRYKARKRIAEVKLEEAAANLLRLDDIVAEVERNLRSLKRQAGAAKRLIEKQEEYRSLLRAVLGGRWSVLHGRLEELRHGLESVTGRDAEQAAALHREEAELAAGREAVDRLAQELAERHQRHSELAALIEGRQEYVKASRRTHQEISERLSAGLALEDRRSVGLEEQTRTLGELDARRGTLVEEHDASAAEVAQDERQIQAAEIATRNAESKQEGLRAQVAIAQGEIARLRSQHHREQLESQKGSVQHQQLGDQLSLFSDQIEESSSLVESTRVRASDLEAEVVGKESDFSIASGQLEEIKTIETELVTSERTLHGEATSIRQRGALLEELSAAYEERRHALREGLAAAGVTAPHFLGDGLAALPGWEKSLDLYLGELADAVVLPRDGNGLTFAEALVQTRTAGKLLRPVDVELPKVDDAAIVTSLGAALGLTDSMAAALPPAYLVESAQDAERLARRHPGIAFLSRERLWAQGGLLHIQGEQAQPGLLARQREAREIAERLPALEQRLLEVRGTIEEKAAERKHLEIRLAQLRTDLGSARQELAVAKARHEDAAKRHHRLSVERETVQTERAE
ncbi:MAG: AAA family ATPase, partial [Acidobacteriota bacterium]